MSETSRGIVRVVVEVQVEVTDPTQLRAYGLQWGSEDGVGTSQVDGDVVRAVSGLVIRAFDDHGKDETGMLLYGSSALPRLDRQPDGSYAGIMLPPMPPDAR